MPQTVDLPHWRVQLRIMRCAELWRTRFWCVRCEVEAMAREVAGVEGPAEALEVHVTGSGSKFMSARHRASRASGKGASVFTRNSVRRWKRSSDFLGVGFVVRSLFVRVHGMCIGWSIELFPILRVQLRFRV